MPNHLRIAFVLSLMIAATIFTAPQASGQIQIRPEDASGMAETLSADQLVKVRLATDAPIIGPGQTVHLAAIEIIMLDNDGWTASANAMCTCIIVIVLVMLGLLQIVSKKTGRKVSGLAAEV